MPTRLRLRLLSVVSALMFVTAALSSAYAQIHGVPPSVTSFGFGGSNSPTPGIAASVTSVGPFGWGGDCCLGPFVSPSHWPRFDGRRRDHDHHQFPVGKTMPIYVPYAVPYPVPYDGYDEDENVDADYTYSRGVSPVYDRGPGYHDSPAPRPMPSEASRTGQEAASAPAASAPQAPVAVQPATVLVYKDGRKVEVQNYAIVGDTLFTFADNRSHRILLADLDLAATEKANDERGVDFQVPARKSQSK